MDNTSTPTSNQASGSRRVESLREWRWHWQTHLDLTSDIDFTPINPPETLIGLRRVLRKSSKSDKGFGTVIEAGQVRLLSRYVIGDTEYPVHVLVMGPWDTQWLVAPFSRFPAPATSGEWITGIDDPDLHTLCLWNARTCPEEALDCSWLSGSVDASILEDAWTVFRHTMTGEPLSEAMEERLGMPLMDAIDPRNIWQDDQALLLEPLSSLSFEKVEEEAKIAEWEDNPDAARANNTYRNEVIVSFPETTKISDLAHLPAAAAGSETVMPVLFTQTGENNLPPCADAKGSAAKVTTFRQSRDKPENLSLRLELIGAKAKPESDFVLIDPDNPSFPLAGGIIDKDGITAIGKWGLYEDLKGVDYDPNKLVLIVQNIPSES